MKIWIKCPPYTLLRRLLEKNRALLLLRKVTTKWTLKHHRFLKRGRQDKAKFNQLFLRISLCTRTFRLMSQFMVETLQEILSSKTSCQDGRILCLHRETILTTLRLLNRLECRQAEVWLLKKKEIHQIGAILSSRVRIITLNFQCRETIYQNVQLLAN